MSTATTAVEHRKRLQHAEVDEASLLDAGDDLDVHARLVSGPARNSSWFSASRTALVATARMGAPEMSAIWRKRASAATPLSMASAASTFMSPPPDPRRTISFSLPTTSNRSSPATRATTRWKEFVPTSIAARVSPTTGHGSGAGSAGQCQPGGRVVARRFQQIEVALDRRVQPGRQRGVGDLAGGREGGVGLGQAEHLGIDPRPEALERHSQRPEAAAFPPASDGDADTSRPCLPENGCG